MRWRKQLAFVKSFIRAILKVSSQRWTIFGKFREFYKAKTAMNSTRREPKIIENKSIGCGLQVSHWDRDSNNLQQERAPQSKDQWFAYTRHKIQRLVWRILVNRIRQIFKWKKPQEFYFAKLQNPFQFKTITTTEEIFIGMGKFKHLVLCSDRLKYDIYTFFY